MNELSKKPIDNTYTNKESMKSLAIQIHTHTSSLGDLLPRRAAWQDVSLTPAFDASIRSQAYIACCAASGFARVCYKLIPVGGKIDALSLAFLTRGRDVPTFFAEEVAFSSKFSDVPHLAAMAPAKLCSEGQIVAEGVLAPWYEGNSVSEVALDDYDFKRLALTLATNIDALHSAGWCLGDITGNNIKVKLDSNGHPSHAVMFDFEMSGLDGRRIPAPLVPYALPLPAAKALYTYSKEHNGAFCTVINKAKDHYDFGHALLGTKVAAERINDAEALSFCQAASWEAAKDCYQKNHQAWVLKRLEFVLAGNADPVVKQILSGLLIDDPAKRMSLKTVVKLLEDDVMPLLPFDSGGSEKKFEALRALQGGVCR